MTSKGGAREADGGVIGPQCSEREAAGEVGAEQAPTAAGALARVRRAPPGGWRHEDLRELQRVVGNRATRALLGAQGPARTVQAKLSVGAPGDRFEQEADRVAREAMALLDAPDAPDAPREPLAAGITPLAAPPGAGDGEPAQRAPGMAGAPADPDAGIGRARGHGAPLPRSLRAPMERVFGVSFAAVRAHADDEAAELNRSMGARAFTTGADVFFGRGEYRPDSAGGRALIAHELAHVVQQAGLPSIEARERGGLVQRQSAWTAWETARITHKHQGNFTAFLGKAVAEKNRTGAGFAKAEVIARILDANVYERPDPSAEKEPVVADLLRRSPGELATMLQALVAALEPANAGATSKITWGPMTAWGAGTEVTALLRPHGHAPGSSAGGDAPWRAHLKRRVTSTNKALYVRGHLLNRWLGGPGLDYNMVPLPSSGELGANDANGAHSAMAEETVKELHEREAGGGAAVAALHYHVVAVPRGAVRPQTKAVDAIATAFDAETKKLPPDTAARTSPTYLKDEATWIDARIKQEPKLVPLFKAVGYRPSDNTFPIPALNTLMTANADLWAKEDEYVPGHLAIDYKWIQPSIVDDKAAPAAQERKERVNIHLPTDLAAGFLRTGGEEAPAADPPAGEPAAAQADIGDDAAPTRNTSFQTFLAEELRASKLDPDHYALARAIAFVLDHDRYELATLGEDFKGVAPELFAGIDGDRNLPADVKQKVKDLVVAKIGTADAFGNALAPAIAKAKGGDEKATLANLSRIVWGPVRRGGEGNVEGTEVRAELRPYGHAEGSDAAGDPAWMLQLQERVSGGATIYVRGHLLNRHLGGPGLDYNMVPLPASGAYGANDVNKAHSRIAEETVKNLYESMRGQSAGAVEALAYRVVALYDRSRAGRRPQTKLVGDAARAFRDAFDQFKAEVSAGYAPELRAMRDAELTSTYADVLKQNDTKQLADLKKSDAGAQALWQLGMYKEQRAEATKDGVSVSAMTAALTADAAEFRGDRRYTDMTKEEKASFDALLQRPHVETLLRAVSSGGNYKAVGFRKLVDRMLSNARLWALEDVWIPSTLMIRYVWRQQGAAHQRDEEIPVRLPTDLGAGFHDRDE